MRESKYIDEYLQEQAERHLKELPPHSPSTFLSYRLTGKAKAFTGNYLRALNRALEWREEEGEIVMMTSAGGSIGYVPAWAMDDRMLIDLDREKADEDSNHRV